jgi:hypothetical protein
MTQNRVATHKPRWFGHLTWAVVSNSTMAVEDSKVRRCCVVGLSAWNILCSCILRIVPLRMGLHQTSSASKPCLCASVGWAPGSGTGIETSTGNCKKIRHTLVSSCLSETTQLA